MSSSSETGHKPQPETENIPTSALLLASVGLCLFLIVVIAASVYGVRGLATQERIRKELGAERAGAESAEQPSVNQEMKAIQEAMESMVEEGQKSMKPEKVPGQNSGESTGAAD